MKNETIWNWQQKEWKQANKWPEFNFDSSKLKELEDSFLKATGLFLGAYKHINEDEKLELIIDLISNEALKTSEIEGEMLSYNNLQTAMRRQFDLPANTNNIRLAEQGISEMMFDIHNNFNQQLSHDLLFSWHKKAMKGRADIKTGSYRTNIKSMQVVSGPIHNQTIHFEAPPSESVEFEMNRYIDWFNNCKLGVLAKAAIAHLYFESIHPFEDGNGRVGRAIILMIISQALGQSAIGGLSQIIYNNRKVYYNMFERSNKSNNINEWVLYFAQAIVDAQFYSIKQVEFFIAKSQFLEQYNALLNMRQIKVILRMFREGIEGFKGGLSAENYITISSTSRATATRDLTALAEIGAFIKTGIGKGTRYQLRLMK